MLKPATAQKLYRGKSILFGCTSRLQSRVINSSNLWLKVGGHKEPNKHQHLIQATCHRRFLHNMPVKFERLSETVVQSQNDPKDYRVIRLENGLTALLIADREDGDSSNTKTGAGDEGKKGEKLAAAALCVGVGSFSDPSDIPGLSHFLEHMVFMGSEKYPNENEFDEFVKKHGGYNNAFTDCELTVFYFNIEKCALYKGLDIFSGFFTNPLMKVDSVDRELKAVDSEFCMSKPNDSVRREQIIGSLAKDGHPMSKFMWGNMESLKETPLKQGIDNYARLREYHVHAYSAHYMTLVVQAMYPLDTLEDWVLEIFSGVPNNNQARPTFHHLKDPFDTDKFNKLYKVIPIKNEHKLVITWSLPSMLEHYQSKPLCYLDFLTGHEGTGSILAYLRKKMWAVELESGTADYNGFEHNATQAIYTVAIKLTESGLEQVNDVVTVVMQYIEMLKKEGPKQWIYDEIKKIRDNDFRWMESEDPVDNVENLCSNMLRYPPSEFITGEKLFVKFDPEPINRCLALMVPHRANFYLSSKKFAPQNICNLKEKWYKTPYCVEEVPAELQQKWKNLEVDPSLHLPAANPFIASDFTLKPAVNPTEYPVAITDNGQSRLYFKQDTKFKTPKAHVSFFLISHAAKKSAENRCMFDVFLEILNHQMSETAYAASVAFLSYQTRRVEHGLVLKVMGFNHKLLRLFETIVDFIADFSVDAALLETMKNKTQKDYYNTVLKPAKLNLELRLALLRCNETTSVDGMRVMDSITVDKMMSFVNELKSVVFVEGLVQGNLTAEEAKSYESYLLKKLNCKPIANKDLPETRVIEVAVDPAYCRTDNLNKNDENSMITNYYQHGPATQRQQTLNDLLMMRMEEPCFDSLRTKRQLGYSVGCRSRVTDGILGFSISIISQAHKFTLEQLDQYMEEFLTEFDAILDKDTQEDFETMKSALITLKNCIDSNLGEEFVRNWEEVEDRTYTFNFLKKQIEFLKEMSLADLKQWYRTYLPSGGQCRKLSIQVEGHKSAAKLTDDVDEETDGDGAPSDGEEAMEEEEEEEEEEMDEDDFNVKELVFKPIEGMATDHVITDVVKMQEKATVYPVSRIL